MKVLIDDLLLVLGIICGLGIFITGLLGFIDVINGRLSNIIMIFIAGILQIIIGINFAAKEKRTEAKVFYGISIIIFGMFFLSIIK